MSLYQEHILDHYKDPSNFGELLDYDVIHAEFNPTCGDKIVMTLKFAGDLLEDIRFSGQGCALSMAAASMLTEVVKGKTKSEIRKFSREKLLELIEVEVNPARKKCAFLGLICLQEGIGSKSI